MITLKPSVLYYTDMFTYVLKKLYSCYDCFCVCQCYSRPIRRPVQTTIVSSLLFDCWTKNCLSLFSNPSYTTNFKLGFSQVSNCCYSKLDNDLDLAESYNVVLQPRAHAITKLTATTTPTQRPGVGRVLQCGAATKGTRCHKVNGYYYTGNQNGELLQRRPLLYFKICRYLDESYITKFSISFGIDRLITNENYKLIFLGYQLLTK